MRIRMGGGAVLDVLNNGRVIRLCHSFSWPLLGSGVIGRERHWWPPPPPFLLSVMPAARSGPRRQGSRILLPIFIYIKFVRIYNTTPYFSPTTTFTPTPVRSVTPNVTCTLTRVFFLPREFYIHPYITGFGMGSIYLYRVEISQLRQNPNNHRQCTTGQRALSASIRKPSVIRILIIRKTRHWTENLSIFHAFGTLESHTRTPVFSEKLIWYLCNLNPGF